jgi:hypothetical protein
MWWTARELSREESELVHEMWPTVYITDKGELKPIVIGFLMVRSFPRRTDGRTGLIKRCASGSRTLAEQLQLACRDTRRDR